MTISSVRSTTVALAAVPLLLAGCGSADGATGSTGDRSSQADATQVHDGSVEYLTETQRARSEMAGGTRLSTRLVDYLPNVHLESSPSRSVLDTVVVGEVVDAEEGTAFKVPEGDVPAGAPNDGQTEVAFGSDEADWQTVHAMVKVSRDLGPTGMDGKTVEVGFVVSPAVDSAEFMEGLRELGPAVFFADSSNPVFAYDENVKGVDGQGSMVATIADDGTLTLPFLPRSIETELLADSPTLEQLTAASQTPSRTLSPPG